jgi:AAA+ ATPase superfamily predicted ATPase
MTQAAFYGRTSELALLERAHATERSELWVVYGRRRVGKTALLEKFAGGKRAFFFTAGRESSRSNLRRFFEGLADFAGQPLLRKVRSPTWSEALSALDQVVGTAPGKTLLVFDEFQWMCRGQSSVLSDLQRLWDTRWKNRGNVHLILCGSAVSFMVGEVLAQKSPLFGRRSGSLALLPLSAAEAKSFFRKRGDFECGEALICLGGVPAYLELFARHGSVRKILDELAFRPHGYLVEEVRFTFGEQLKEKERYLQIASLLAGAPASMAQLSRSTGLNKGQLAFYLERLIELGFVEKHRPITLPDTSKTVRYRLQDEYLRFYFSLIEPNLTRIRTSRTGYGLDRIARDRFDTFLGHGFELMVARNVAVLLEVTDAADVVSRIGSYWHHQTARREGVQIDLVVERDDGITHLVECKWSRKPVGKGVWTELQRKCSLYPNPKQHTLEPVLVAAAGATPSVRDADVPVVTLADLLRS